MCFGRAGAAPPLLGLGARWANAETSAPDFLRPPFKYPVGTKIEKSAAFPLPRDQLQKTIAEKEAGSHNNFYEFLLGEGGFVCPLTNDFEVEPWAVEVSGECNKPTTFDLDAINAIGLEERLYAFRCVERWVMNVPWVGVPLAKLLERAEPTSDAKFVRFVSAAHR